MTDYYSKKLSANRLKLVYDLAPPRVQQYLTAEINFAIKHLQPNFRLLELGCGYGRLLKLIHRDSLLIVGIDNSLGNLRMGQNYLSGITNTRLAMMDAIKLGFNDCIFDVVLCLQNGISAFHVNREMLMEEALRITRPGGKVLFSSYSEKFWDVRLEWFELQSQHKLIGEIDYNKTANGNIFCKDGFTASTLSADEFNKLASSCDVEFKIEEIDESSLFCILTKPAGNK